MSAPDPRPSSRTDRLLLRGLSVATVVLAGVVIFRRAPAPATGIVPAPTAPSVRRSSSAPASLLVTSSPIPPIPAKLELDARKVALGRRLFHDAALSRDGTIACASCHDIRAGGDDGRRVSIGVGGAEGRVNAPTVLNSAFNFRQFWDGRARTLEDQVDGPIQHPAEMGMEWGAVLAYLAGEPEYVRRFAELYDGPPTQERVKDAIATFERSLVTPGCAFDRYLLGDAQALSDEARAGYELFLSLGCVSCHQGVNTGGNMFQPLGKMEDFFAARGTGVEHADLGRFNVTGDERDRFTFKVPSLRNVELTAPYFHDGSVATLEEAVQLMARYQLGEDLGAEEVSRIVAFLRSLTGNLPGDH
jgi:cytochrome c peroxidase